METMKDLTPEQRAEVAQQVAKALRALHTAAMRAAEKQVARKYAEKGNQS